MKNPQESDQIEPEIKICEICDSICEEDRDTPNGAMCEDCYDDYVDGLFPERD